MTLTRNRAVVVTVAFLVVASLGVGSVASLTQGNALTVQDPENAQVRVAHMSADAPAVNVLVDNETVEQNLEFGDVTDYLDLQEGEHQVSIVTVENETTVFDGQVSVEANEKYTLMAIGGVSENATQSFDVVALQDARRAPNGTDASVRLVHVAPDAGPVDVTINQTGDVLYDNVTYANATDYVTVPSGVYTLNVREATEGNDGQIVNTFTVSLMNQTAYSAFAAPGSERPDEELLLFTQIDVTDNPEIPGVTTTAEETTTGEMGNETTTAEMGNETTTEEIAEETTTEA